jgi:hypothetical protein
MRRKNAEPTEAHMADGLHAVQLTADASALEYGGALCLVTMRRCVVRGHFATIQP